VVGWKDYQLHLWSGVWKAQSADPERKKNTF